MMRLRDISVRYKFAAVILVATTTAVSLMSGAFLAYDYSSSRREALDELQTIGKITAANSSAAVAFGDRAAAAEILNTLNSEKDVQNACAYDATFHVLAQFHRVTDDQCPASVTQDGWARLSGQTAVFGQAIRVNESTAGYVFVESNLTHLHARRYRVIALTGMFLIGSLIAGVLLGVVLQRWIVRPITDLSNVISEVSESRNFELRAVPLGGDEIGRLVVGFNQMLGEIQGSHSKLKQQALNDELTGLPNRRLFADRLSQALALAKRQEGMTSVIYMDLDGFKLVNDTLGHSVGDLLLRQVSDRLKARVRASDTLARVGGDEFTLVASPIRNAKEAKLIADELLSQLASPFVIGEHELMLTASIGISLYPNDGTEAEQLVQQADTAMYVAKGSGKNKVTFFSPEFGDAVRERLELENQLRGALDRGEISVHYQPEFELETRRLVRFESLARWNNPTLGSISPMKFIPIAEESGLIIPLGKWIMEQACREAVRWQSVSSFPVMVAVNVSSIQFLQNDFVGVVAQVLESTGLEPGLLQLEVTESVLMPGNGDCMTKMAQLRSLGVSLAVDDFGTGYSSLSYLPRMPFDYLKIDRSFLNQIMASKDPRAMMGAIIDLAHNLKMRVIIEGVETQEQLALIDRMGCDEVQGYAFGRPTPSPEQFLGSARGPSSEEHSPTISLATVGDANYGQVAD